MSNPADHPNLRVVDHPLIRHKLSQLRSTSTGMRSFRELADEIAILMTFEATADLPLEPVEVQTPLETMTGERIRGKKPVLVPVLRAGLGLVKAVLSIIPAAKVGHVGLYRDEESLEPVEYYSNIPPHPGERDFIVLDPMLATGGSASAAISLLKREGARSVRLMCLVAAPEGVRQLEEDHPDVMIYAAALDRELNEHGYIVPGLGDAGDRLYGTA